MDAKGGQIINIVGFWNIGEVEKVKPYLVEVVCNKGEVLFKPKDVADNVYFLVQGRLAVQVMTGFGNKMQVVALLEQGAVVGEGGVIENQNRNTTIVAIENSKLIGLSQKSLYELEKDHPEIIIKLIKHLLAVTNMRLLKISERLAHVM